MIATYLNERGERVEFVPDLYARGHIFINTKTGKKFQILGVDTEKNRVTFRTAVSGRSIQSEYLLSSLIRDVSGGAFINQTFNNFILEKYPQFKNFNSHD